MTATAPSCPTTPGPGTRVVAVATSPVHGFSKEAVGSIDLLVGTGVVGDAHSGATVQHRSRVRRDPTRPNLRQVHLLHAELLDEVAEHGYDVRPGQLGENLTTRGVDLLALPVGTVLRLGPEAEVELTGLRNPCWQIDAFRAGLLAHMVGRDAHGRPVLKAGVMAVVRRSGAVTAHAPVVVVPPPPPHRALARV
jgi:MOSC domain-containing protein YiiM